MKGDRARFLWPLLALALILAWNAVFTERFLSFEWKEGRLYGPLIDVVHRGTPVMLLALGMTPVIGTGGIDLSVGSVMAMAAAICALLLAAGALPVAAVLALAIAFGCAAGLWNGALVALLRVQPVVATLILLVAGRGLAQLFTGGKKIAFSSPAFESLAGGTVLGLPVTFFIAGGLFGLLLLLQRRTALGLYVESIGDNERAAHLAGLPVRPVKLAVYGMCGGIAALAGAIACADIRQADVFLTGQYLELDAILSVVIGGTALTGGRTSLVGSVIGALVIQTLTTSLYLRGLGPEDALILKALAVVAVCALRLPGLGKLVRRRRPEATR